MIPIQTDITGKNTQFGYLMDHIESYGFTIGGDWDYDHGYIDHILSRVGGNTIYLRLPFIVTDGQMDSYQTEIRFLQPFIVEHIVHVGLDQEDNSLLDATGFSQFQTPLAKDAPITNQTKWIQAGEQIISRRLMPYVQ